jgi:hypothetical protein
MRTDIAFQATDGTTLRGWHYKPENAGKHPTIVMAHGFSAAVRAPSWPNEVTLRTIEYGFGYEPGAYIGLIAPTPLMMIVAVNDHLTVSWFCSLAGISPPTLKGLSTHQDLMWTAFEAASAVCRQALLVPSEALRQLGRLELFDATAQLQHGIERFRGSTVCKAGRQVVPPLLKLIHVVCQRLHRVSPLLRSTSPIGRPAVSNNHWRFRRHCCGGSNLAPRPVGCGPFGGGRGAIAARWWSWHRKPHIP